MNIFGRALKLGRNIGFSAVMSKSFPSARRATPKPAWREEAEKLAARLPDGAHIVLLDARARA